VLFVTQQLVLEKSLSLQITLLPDGEDLRSGQDEPVVSLLATVQVGVEYLGSML
jgi:hypothetical protein